MAGECLIDCSSSCDLCNGIVVVRVAAGNGVGFENKLSVSEYRERSLLPRFDDETFSDAFIFWIVTPQGRHYSDANPNLL